MISRNKSILLLIIFISLLLSSCPNLIIKNTLWLGTTHSSLYPPGNIEIYFWGDKNIRAYIEISFGPSSGNYIFLDGTYTLEDTYTFSASLNGDALLDADALPEIIHLDVSGALNFYTGIGSGNYNIQLNYTNPLNTVNDTGSWELEKLE